MDKNLPYWIIYRDKNFDDILDKLLKGEQEEYINVIK